MKEKISNFADKYLTPITLLVAISALLLGLASKYYSNENFNVDIGAQTLIANAPVEIALSASDSLIVNNDSALIADTDDDYNVNYTIAADKKETFSGITADEKGNLFICVTCSEKSSVQPSSTKINKYDANGDFVKTLYTVDFEHSDIDAVRISPLYYANDALYFTEYNKADNRILRIDLNTGTVIVLATLSSDIPFMYSDIVPVNDSTYYFTKINGDIGRGIFGGHESILYTAQFDSESNAGIRPFYVRPLGENIYILDTCSKTVFELADGTPKVVKALTERGFNGETTQLNISNGHLNGISEGKLWTYDTNRLNVYDSHSNITSLPALCIIIEKSFNVVFYFLIYAGGILAFLCLIWLVAIRGKSIVGKTTFYSILMLFLLLFISYQSFLTENEEYLDTYNKHLQSDASITAFNINGDTISAFDGSQSINSPEYKKLSHNLYNIFGYYEGGDDIATLILSDTRKSDSDVILVSTRRLHDILSDTSTFGTLTSQTRETREPSYGKIDGMITACAPIFDSNNEISGYVVMYSIKEITILDFMHTWKLSNGRGGFVALIVGLVLLAVFLFSRRVNTAIETVKKIEEGDFKARIKWNTQDEFGALATNINVMAENIDKLIKENSTLTQEVVESQHVVLAQLASITERKDGGTERHVERVGEFSRLLGSYLGYDYDELEYLSIAAMLHDVGKIFVPLEILSKPGELSKEEFDIVMKHTQDGESLLRDAPGDIMVKARVIALEHHERWDGAGYAGLKGDEIHLDARIVALADVFDALMSSRPYKEPFPLEQVRKIIEEESGKQFDPQVAHVALDHFDELVAIYESLSHDSQV